jgi:hypothetical protein
MKLDEFAAGDVYCDVNIFYMFLVTMSPSASKTD